MSLERYLLAMALLAGGAAAQLPRTPGGYPVHLAEVKVPADVKAGDSFTAQARVTIDVPYHIYGLKALDVEVPTTFGIRGGDGRVKIAGEVKADRPPEMHADDITSYTYWEREVTFTIPMRVSGDAGQLAFELLIDHMACTMQACLPGNTLAGKVSLSVLAADPPSNGAPDPSSSASKVRIVAATDPGSVKVGEVFTVGLKLGIEPPFHIYGLKLVDAEMPTRISVTQGGAVELAGPVRAARTPKRHADEISKYDYWEGNVSFLVPLRVKPGDGRGAGTSVKPEFKLQVDLMACTMEFCLQPGTVTVAFPWKGTTLEALPAAVWPDADANTANNGNGGGAGLPEPVEGALPGLEAVTASFEEPEIEPGETWALLITLPRALEAESAADARIVFAGSDLSVAGDAVVQDGAGDVVLRVPVELASVGVQAGDLEFRGVLAVGGRSIPFSGSTHVHVPILGFLMVAALAALIALLTPCVFPMIPITISFFTKQAETSRSSPLVMGFLYAAGIVISFTAIGVIFTMALGGAGAANFALHWGTQLFIALLFIVFALSLFGLFDLQLPSWMMNLTGKAQGQGGALGVWLLGLLFAVTTFTCTAPFVGGLLASAAGSGQWMRPVLGMLVFSGVLALPFFFLAVFPARLKSLPRSGSWLNMVKVCMGFIELAAAFKFLGGADFNAGWGVFTRGFIISFWVAIFLVQGLYLLGTFKLPHDSPAEKTGVWPLMFGLASLALAAFLTRGLDGSELNPDFDAYLPPEVHARTPEGREAHLIERLTHALGGRGAIGGSEGSMGLGYANMIKDDYQSALARARKLGAPLFIEFTAPG